MIEYDCEGHPMWVPFCVHIDGSRQHRRMARLPCSVNDMCLEVCYDRSTHLNLRVLHSRLWKGLSNFSHRWEFHTTSQNITCNLQRCKLLFHEFQFCKAFELLIGSQVIHPNERWFILRFLVGYNRGLYCDQRLVVCLCT